jgi:hypothetical protein
MIVCVCYSLDAMKLLSVSNSRRQSFSSTRVRLEGNWGEFFPFVI